MVFRKILFSTDFSSNADGALAHAIQLANFDSGELIFQHVVSDFEKHPYAAGLFDLHELQTFMDRYVESHLPPAVSRESGKVYIQSVISKGKPAEEITALAEKELVDLVVMGSAKGAVTNKVIRMTSRPVLAISSKLPHAGDAGLRKIDKILVATDFSQYSRKVIEYAFDLKRTFDTSIYMLYVLETSDAIDSAVRQTHFVDTIEKMREWAANQLIHLTPDAFVNDPKVIRLVEAGSPGDTIADVAREIGADLTILGTHEYGTIHKHLRGTTPDRLLTRSATPVLTVKL